MRRLAVLSLAPMVAVAATLGGCTGKGTGTPSAAGTGSTALAVASAAASPSTDASDPVLANTRQVCGQINEVIAQGSMTFGVDLGNVAGHLAGGNKTEADKSRNDAINQLRTMSTKIRTLGTSAQDDRVRSAAQRTADQISALASDPVLRSQVKSASDLAPVIEKLTRGTDSMNSVCV